MKTIRAEARRLLELAADDGELRADLRALAEEILAATEVSSPSVSSARAWASNIRCQAQRIPSMKSWPANRSPILFRLTMTPPNRCEN